MYSASNFVLSLVYEFVENKWHYHIFTILSTFDFNFYNNIYKDIDYQNIRMRLLMTVSSCQKELF